MKHLPEEITEEILYSLPIKSLLRFKCVSKPWHSVISSKAFIKEHLKRSIAKDDKSGLTDLNHHKLLIVYKHTDQNKPSRYSYGLGSSSLGSKPNIKLSLYDSPNPHLGFLIMGSCNGIILIRYTVQQIGPLILLNPSTRKSRIIPTPSFDPAPQQNYFRVGSYSFIFGLGYDESNDEYKVVCIRDDTNLQEPQQTQVYSSNTDSWKKIESFNKLFQISHSGKFLNGRLHWLVRPDSRYSHCEIISLDLVGEKYQYQTLSSHHIDYFRSVCLVELGGYLGVTSLNDNLDINVWVMKEYGVRESWTKIWTLSDFVDDTRMCLHRGVTALLCWRKNGDIVVVSTPLCWRKNGDIVVVSGDYVFVVNGKNVLHTSQVCNMFRDRIASIVYVESLVSP